MLRGLGACKSVDLVARLQDPDTFDISLQLFMIKLKEAVESLFETEVPSFTDLEFVANFGTDVRRTEDGDEIHDRVSVKLRQPVVAHIDAVCWIRPSQMACGWTFRATRRHDGRVTDVLGQYVSKFLPRGEVVRSGDAPTGDREFRELDI